MFVFEGERYGEAGAQKRRGRWTAAYAKASAWGLSGKVWLKEGRKEARKEPR